MAICVSTSGATAEVLEDCLAICSIAYFLVMISCPQPWPRPRRRPTDTQSQAPVDAGFGTVSMRIGGSLTVHVAWFISALGSCCINTDYVTVP